MHKMHDLSDVRIILDCQFMEDKLGKDPARFLTQLLDIYGLAPETLIHAYEKQEHSLLTISIKELAFDGEQSTYPALDTTLMNYVHDNIGYYILHDVSEVIEEVKAYICCDANIGHDYDNGLYLYVSPKNENYYNGKIVVNERA